MPWGFLTSVPSKDESVLDVEGAYFSEDELDTLGIDTTTDDGTESVTIDNSILDSVMSASTSDTKSLVVTRKPNPRLQARLERLEQVDEDSENLRNSSESLSIDRRSWGEEWSGHHRSPRDNMSPMEVRRPLSVRNSDSKTPKGRSAFGFDEADLPKKANNPSISPSCQSSSSRIFQSPRALPVSHVNTLLFLSLIYF